MDGDIKDQESGSSGVDIEVANKYNELTSKDAGDSGHPIWKLSGSIDDEGDRSTRVLNLLEEGYTPTNDIFEPTSIKNAEDLIQLSRLEEEVPYDSQFRESRVFTKSKFNQFVTTDIGLMLRPARRNSDKMRPTARVLVIIDLDNFKADVNDKFGHDAGDLALDCITEAMRDVLRSEDVIGRLGNGDEFGLWMKGNDAQVLKQVLFEKRGENGESQPGILDQVRNQMNQIISNRLDELFPEKASAWLAISKDNNGMFFDFTAGVASSEMIDPSLSAEENFKKIISSADDDLRENKLMKKVGR